MTYFLLLIIAGQFALFWLYVRERAKADAAERDKLIDRIQTGDARLANQLAQEKPKDAPRTLIANFGSLDGVEMVGGR